MNLTTGLISVEQTHLLRHAVLWPHLSKPEECVLAEDSLLSSFHMGCFAGEDLVGIATLVSQPWNSLPGGPQMRLRAMATRPDLQGHNVGSVLMKSILDELYREKIRWVWCDARVTAIGFYRRVGWAVDSEIYEVAHVGQHQRAFLPIWGGV